MRFLRSLKFFLFSYYITSPIQTKKLSALRAKLNDLAQSSCNTPVDVGDCLMKKECLQALESLRSNSDILITKPDKGCGVVVMDKSDHILKMEKILHDTS